MPSTSTIYNVLVTNNPLAPTHDYWKGALGGFYQYYTSGNATNQVALVENQDLQVMNPQAQQVVHHHYYHDSYDNGNDISSRHHAAKSTKSKTNAQNDSKDESKDNDGVSIIAIIAAATAVAYPIVSFGYNYYTQGKNYNIHHFLGSSALLGAGITCATYLLSTPLLPYIGVGITLAAYSIEIITNYFNATNQLPNDLQPKATSDEHVNQATSATSVAEPAVDAPAAATITTSSSEQHQRDLLAQCIRKGITTAQNHYNQPYYRGQGLQPANSWVERDSNQKQNQQHTR